MTRSYINKKFWKNKNDLITGGTGFLGGWIVKALIDLNSNLFIIQRSNRIEIQFNIKKFFNVTKVINWTIENKTLIVWGDKDLSYNFEQVNILNKNIPNSKLEIFKECSHNLHLEQPKKFNDTVQNFLNE